MSQVQLTHVGVHFDGEIWTLMRVQSGLELLDSEGVVVTRIPAEEVGTRIILPSFLRSLPFLLILGKKTTHAFKNTRAEIRVVRDLIADCVKQAPSAAGTDCIARAKSAFAFGGPFLLIGIAFATGGVFDRNVHLILLGLIAFGVGMIALARAVLLVIKARSLRAKARANHPDESSNPDTDTDAE